MMELGEKLKSHRENKGFSQVFVAEKLNVSRQSISKWENDRGYPDYDNLILLSQLYEVSIGELLDENEKLKKKLNIIMKILLVRNRSSDF
nr:helix-turn-helix transcriptional regulator [Enterococcus innesii]